MKDPDPTAGIERAIAICGEALKTHGKLEAAAESIGKALALEPELAVAHSNLGNIRHAQGELEQALACYERALALQPDLAMAYANMGNLREAQGLLREAATCYERALELKPVFRRLETFLTPLLLAREPMSRH